MGRREARADLARVRRELDEARENLAERILELEKLEEQIARKREARERHDEDTRRHEELERQVDELRRQAIHLRERRKALQGRVRELRRRARKLARRVRNLARPKVVDLGLWRDANGTPERQGTVPGLVGHYTAGPTDDDDEEAIALWRSYDRAHKNQGWLCIGYPWGLTRDGTIVLLRGRQWVGAHTLGWNHWDGCSVHGTLGDTWTRAQRRAYRYALRRFGLADKPVRGHKQMPGQATSCPGDFLAGYERKGR